MKKLIILIYLATSAFLLINAYHVYNFGIGFFLESSGINNPTSMIIIDLFLSYFLFKSALNRIFQNDNTQENAL